MSFKRYIPHRRIGDVIYVMKQGHIFISRSIMDKYFEDATHVVLSYDSANRLIGFMPTKDSKHALKICSFGQGSHEISGIGFIHKFNLQEICGKRYKPIYKDKLVIIDLAKPI